MKPGDVVSVFGGSAAKQGTTAYVQAEALGHHLGKAGLCVATGGYIGTMEAVSKGASLAGGHVIGVTCDQIEEWRPILPNKWVHEEMRLPTLRERVYRLIEIGQALVALPGGLGTLSEISLAWSLMQTAEIAPRPFILVGELWQRTIRTFIDEAQGFLAPTHIELLTFKHDVREAVELLVRI